MLDAVPRTEYGSAFASLLSIAFLLAMAAIPFMAAYVRENLGRRRRSRRQEVCAFLGYDRVVLYRTADHHRLNRLASRTAQQS
ncbi:MAG: hypothetical protein R3D80_14305 [Paracoccaceae bacterium]